MILLIDMQFKLCPFYDQITLSRWDFVSYLWERIMDLKTWKNVRDFSIWLLNICSFTGDPVIHCIWHFTALWLKYTWNKKNMRKQCTCSNVLSSAAKRHLVITTSNLQILTWTLAICISSGKSRILLWKSLIARIKNMNNITAARPRKKRTWCLLLMQRCK